MFPAKRVAAAIVATLAACLLALGAFDAYVDSRALPSFLARNSFGQTSATQVGLGTLKIHAPYASPLGEAKTRKRISNSNALPGNSTPTSFSVKVIAIYLAASNDPADKTKIGERRVVVCSVWCVCLCARARSQPVD